MWEIPWLFLSTEQGGSNITPVPERVLLGQVATASCLLEGNHHVQRETAQKPPYHKKPKPHTVVQSFSRDRLFAAPELQHARLPCPSPSPGAQIHVHWVGDAIQRSHPLSSLLLLPSVYPGSGSFSVSWLFTSGGQSIDHMETP